MNRFALVVVTGLLTLMLTACGEQSAPKPAAAPDSNVAQPAADQPAAPQQDQGQSN